jgi:hypothetical protein
MAEEPEGERLQSIWPNASVRVVTNFLIGTVAGLASTFLPRLMLLLSIDTELAPGRFISVLSSDFVLVACIFGLAIGLICAILESNSLAHPKDVFMTALGIPALVGGVLTTTSATGKLQQAEQQKVEAWRTVRDQAGLSSQAQTETLEVVGAPPAAPGPSSRLDGFFAFVSPAFAQSSSRALQVPATRFDPGIQIQRPRYVLVLKRATSQDEAMRLAKELQKDVPTAQAVKTDQGFFVVDSVTARSEGDALLDAIQLKKRQLSPSLLRVPR